MIFWNYDNILWNYYTIVMRLHHKCLVSYSGGSRISHWGGHRPIGGHQPPMHTLFGENICENERNGSCWGGMHRQHPPGSTNELQWNKYTANQYYMHGL